MIQYNLNKLQLIGCNVEQETKYNLTGYEGTVCVISRDPLCKEGNARFATVPLKP